MKIQCDVCSKKEASVFCSADEAALCDACDQRVHHANKLACKHERFSLLHPSPSSAPLCDICKEKRAHVFCQQDRAIFCRDCELPIHTANEHTQKHNRFLLTGIKLSAISNNTNTNNININANNPSIKNGCDTVPDFKPSVKKPNSLSSETPPAGLSSTNQVISGTNHNNNNNQHQSSGGSTSSISEYLIETLPGWHFEDFFLDSAFCKSNEFEFGFGGDQDMMSFWDVNLDKELTSYSSSSSQSENLGIRVPQAPAAAAAAATVMYNHQPTNFQKEINGLFVNQVQESTKKQETNINGTAVKVSKKWRRDYNFTVPQIIQSVGSNKKPRTFW